MLKTICRISIVFLTITYVTSPFHSVDLRLWTFVNALAILVCAVPLMGNTFRRSALFFFCSGAMLLAQAGQPFAEWLAGVISLLNIVAILAIMQLFSIPIQIGKYSAALETLLIRQFANETGLFLFVTAATHIFASFLLFGTIPVMLSLFGDILQRNTSDYKRFAATALSRGYSLVVLWTPGGVNILLVLQATGVSWSEIVLPGMMLSISGVLLSILIERRRFPAGGCRSAYTGGWPIDLSLQEAWLKLTDILAVVGGLVALIILLESAGFAGPTTRILYSGLIIVSLWLLRLGKQPGFSAAVADYWHNGLLKTVDLAALFICMGLFSRGVVLSGFLDFMRPYLLTVVALLGPSGLLTVIPILIVAAALGGLHPFISIVILGKMIMSLDLPVSAKSVAMALSLGGAVSYAVSPFAGIVLTLARFLDTTPVNIALRWNWIFSSSLIFFGVMFIFWLNLVWV